MRMMHGTEYNWIKDSQYSPFSKRAGLFQKKEKSVAQKPCGRPDHLEKRTIVNDQKKGELVWQIQKGSSR